MQMSIHLFVFKGHFREDFEGGSGGNGTSGSIEKAVIWSRRHALYARGLFFYVSIQYYQF